MRCSCLQVINSGSTIGAVNFPNLELPMSDSSHRVLNIHRNVPGVLRDINNIFANLDANIRAQLLGTTNNIGYLIVDLNKEISNEVKAEIKRLGSNLRTRILY
ncbi:hypothetical protein CYMTET_9183 [Cymbomonas tetramitiformis]|uniref:ACT domain-containing protein n=1 Tax=Cymbomonas tetramitiformis TaxID=36881 RepID=A0AAE0GRK7_9CHLO|nr:hypothetical protein CYMTET_9183 [Cymbomonas tetramitiformis]